LGTNVHDPIISCIESDIGQHSENLADALNRSFTKDGRPILQVLHMEGQLKKVQTSQIIMTPAPNTKIKLEELNTILNEMKQGEEAVKRLAEMDKSRGIQDPADVIRRMRGPQNQPLESTGDALGDAAIAKQRMEQAHKMEREAKGLLAEAQRLITEAQSLDPSLTAQPAPVVTEAAPAKVRKTRAKVST
jgi:hypothetical protein